MLIFGEKYLSVENFDVPIHIVSDFFYPVLFVVIHEKFIQNLWYLLMCDRERDCTN